MEPAPLAAEQPALDGLAGDVVVEAEHVGLGLDQQAAGRPPPAAGAISSSSDAPVTLASTSNVHPAAEHGGRRDDPAHVGVEVVDLVADQLGHRPRQRHGRRGRRRCRSPALRHQLLEEERVAAGAGVQRLDDAVRRHVAVHRGEEGADVGRAEPPELDVGDRVPAFEPGEQLGRRVAAGQPVGPVGAHHQQPAPAGLGQLLEHGDALGVGPVQVLEHDEAGGARREPADQLDRRSGCAPRPCGRGRRWPRPASAWSSVGTRPRASRNSSIGRLSLPGSAWPARTTVSAGTWPTSSLTRRVLPMPASPATRATAGSGRAPTRPVRRSSSAARPTITGESPVRPTSMARAYGAGVTPAPRVMPRGGGTVRPPVAPTCAPAGR